MARSWMQRAVRSIARRAAKYAGIPLRDPALVTMLGSQPSAAGVDVDENLALNLSGVWAATTVIASAFASCPAVPHSLSNGSFHEARDIPAWRMLLVAPNHEMTTYVFHETMAAHAIIWGNAYAKTDKESPEDMATEMWPMMPNQVEPKRDKNGEIVYHFTALFDGERDEEIPWWKVVHVPGLSFDGIKGYSVVNQARESIGLALAAEKFGASFFGRGCIPGGIIEFPAELKMSKKARANLRESFELLHRGPDNAHRLAILEQGMTYKPLSVPLNDAQFLETRKFQIVEIARWFNVPPHKLRDLDRATFSNIEHQSIEFHQDTMRPWFIRFAEEYRRKLFGAYDQTRHCVLHNTRKMLMTDIRTRFAAYGQARNGGWYTLNDILREEGLPLLPSGIGDQRLAPSTMKVIGGADPSTPVDPTVLRSITETLQAMRPMSKEKATYVLKSVIPQATDEFVDALLEKVDIEGDGPQKWALTDETKRTTIGEQVLEILQAVYATNIPKEAGVQAMMILLGISYDEAQKMFPEKGGLQP